MTKSILLFLLIGSFSSSQLFCQSGDWLSYNEDNSPLPSNYVRAITQDLDSAIWISTFGGVLKIKDGEYEVFNTTNSGIESNNVHDIVVDSDNTKWMGTYFGLSKYKDGVWTNYTESNSDLHYHNILSLSLDNEENLWIGTASNSPWNTLGGVSRFDREEEWIHYSPDNSGLLGKNVRTVFAIDTGHVWFGGVDGLSIKNGETWTTYTSDNSPLPFDAINDITRDENGWFWLGNYSGGWPAGGLVKFNGVDDWTIYDTSNSSLVTNSIENITIDGCGIIWCANDFLNRFDGENWSLFDTTNSPIQDNSITIVFEDLFGHVWLGTINHGVRVFKNDCYDTVSTDLLSDQNKISIFPNPFENEINLMSTTAQESLHDFSLYDARGRQIETGKNIDFSNGGWKKDLSDLPSGIYFYQISDQDNVITTGKLIKN